MVQISLKTNKVELFTAFSSESSMYDDKENTAFPNVEIIGAKRRD